LPNCTLAAITLHDTSTKAIMAIGSPTMRVKRVRWYFAGSPQAMLISGVNQVSPRISSQRNNRAPLGAPPREAAATGGGTICGAEAAAGAAAGVRPDAEGAGAVAVVIIEFQNIRL
jgi:hypothetical protein